MNHDEKAQAIVDICDGAQIEGFVLRAHDNGPVLNLHIEMQRSDGRWVGDVYELAIYETTAWQITFRYSRSYAYSTGQETYDIPTNISIANYGPNLRNILNNILSVLS